MANTEEKKAINLVKANPKLAGSKGGKKGGVKPKEWYSNPSTATRKLDSMSQAQLSELMNRKSLDNVPAGMARMIRLMRAELSETDPVKKSMVVKMINETGYGKPTQYIEQVNAEATLTPEEKMALFDKKLSEHLKED